MNRINGERKITTMNNIDTMSVNALRVLSADAIQKAKSGHPGLPLGCATVAYDIWAKEMKHNPANPDWADRDRFIERFQRLPPGGRHFANPL